MTQKEISDVFLTFDNFEQGSISMLIKTVYGDKCQTYCNDVVKILLLIERLRFSIEQIRPLNLLPESRLRNKRFLFLSAQGLELIQGATSNTLIKEVLKREINYIKAKFSSIDEYDSSRIVVNGEAYLRDFDRMLETAKKYDLCAFRSAIANL